MRNISFMHTTEQVRARTKTVTRRLGWLFLKPGDLLCAVEKSQGLGKGGRIKRICTIRVVDVRREKLYRMMLEAGYGPAECALEGFPPPHVNSDPREFVKFFCASHKGCMPASMVTRIEFAYID